MNIDLQEITISELVQNYQDNEENGVVGFDGQLDIRPPFQREFIYKDHQKEKEIIKFAEEFANGVLNGATTEDMCFAICAPLSALLSGMKVTNELCRCEIRIGNTIVEHFIIVAFIEGNVRILDPTANQFNEKLSMEMPQTYCGEIPSHYRKVGYYGGEGELAVAMDKWRKQSQEAIDRHFHQSIENGDARITDQYVISWFRKEHPTL